MKESSETGLVKKNEKNSMGKLWQIFFSKKKKFSIKII